MTSPVFVLLSGLILATQGSADRDNNQQIEQMVNMMAAEMGELREEMDEKDKESLHELQQGMAQAQQETQMLQAKLQMRDSERRRSDLTLHELADLPDTARAYKQVGKMFLMHSLPDLVQSLTDKSANCEKEVGALKEKLTHVVAASEKVEADCPVTASTSPRKAA